jgi:molecular chaperone GrpE
MDRRVRVPIHVDRERVDEEPSAPEVERAISDAEAVEPDLDEWRDRALRLQAEMENYRKRQQRLAEARILEERERLLRAFLDVIDNLERALDAGEVDVDSLRQGVGVTYQAAKQLLDREGVESVAAEGRQFDPAWHEAMGSIPVGDKVEPGTVIEVVQRGYRLGDRLLRPARVIVAA